MDRIPDPRVKALLGSGRAGKPGTVRIPTFPQAELMAHAALSHAGLLSHVPIDIEELARSVGIVDISWSDSLTKSAVLMSIPGTDLAGILVNRKDSPRRRRFSIAHEIAHRLIHPTTVAHNLGPTAYRGTRRDALERIADYMASCLLMPRAEIDRRARPDVMTIELCREFDVSFVAMAARLRELGHIERKG